MGTSEALGIRKAERKIEGIRQAEVYKPSLKEQAIRGARHTGEALGRGAQRIAHETGSFIHKTMKEEYESRKAIAKEQAMAEAKGHGSPSVIRERIRQEFRAKEKGIPMGDQGNPMLEVQPIGGSHDFFNQKAQGQSHGFNDMFGNGPHNEMDLRPQGQGKGKKIKPMPLM
jgi:hypothetical protein